MLAIIYEQALSNKWEFLILFARLDKEFKVFARHNPSTEKVSLNLDYVDTVTNMKSDTWVPNVLRVPVEHNADDKSNLHLSNFIWIFVVNPGIFH